RPTQPERRGGRQPVAPAPPVTVRSVVGPRQLGSLADLLGTGAPVRIPRSGSVDDAETEFLPAQATHVAAEVDRRPDLAADLTELADGECWEYADGEEYAEDEDYEDEPQE